MTRGILIGGGSVPVKSILISVVGADDELSYDAENKTFNSPNISSIFPNDTNK